MSNVLRMRLAQVLEAVRTRSWSSLSGEIPSATAIPTVSVILLVFRFPSRHRAQRSLRQKRLSLEA